VPPFFVLMKNGMLSILTIGVNTQFDDEATFTIEVLGFFMLERT